MTITECPECGNLYNADHEHTCGYVVSPCRECGLVHDGFSSLTTGIETCLHALAYETRRDRACRNCGQIPKAALASMIRSNLRGADGLRVIASGELAKANGYPRGTAWVEIEADSILDCDLAEYRLSGRAEIKPAAWANGWTLAENQQRETSLRLRLYASR